jgi:hypothetical protein
MTVMRDHPRQPLTGYVSMDDGERIARVTAFQRSQISVRWAAE